MTQRFSHTDYTAQKLHEAFMAVRYTDGVPVSVIAEIMGVSESQVYTWSDVDQFEKAKAKYVWALASGLAVRLRNYRLIQILLPVGARIALSEEIPGADGKIEDEVTDGTIGLAQVAMAHQGKDAEGLKAARLHLEGVIKRIAQEEATLRQTTDA